MSQREQINLNDLIEESPFDNFDSENLFHFQQPSKKKRLLLEEDDGISPWFDDLEPKLTTFSPKNFQASRTQTHSFHIPKPELKARRGSAKLRAPQAEKIQSRFYKDSKPLDIKSEDKNDVFCNELIKSHVPATVHKIGLTDSSSMPQVNQLSHPQLLVGNFVEETNVIGNNKKNQETKLVSPKQEKLVLAKKSRASFITNVDINLKQLEKERLKTDTIDSYRVYSNTARCFQEAKEEEKQFNSLNTSKEEKGNKSTIVVETNQVDRSKKHYLKLVNMGLITHNNGFPITRNLSSFVPLKGEGKKIVTIQNDRRPSTKSIIWREEKQEKIEKNHEEKKEDIKNKMKVLRKIKYTNYLPTKVSPSPRDRMESRERERSTSNWHQRSGTHGNISYETLKTEPCQVLRTQESETQTEGKSFIYRTIGPKSSLKLISNGTRLKKLSKNIIPNTFQAEGVKAPFPREKFETSSSEKDLQLVLRKTEGNQQNETKEKKNKLRSVVSPRSRTSSKFGPQYSTKKETDKMVQNSLLVREMSVKSYIKNDEKRKSTILLRSQSPDKNAYFDRKTKEEANLSTLLNNKSRKVVKQPNLEIQAALFQGRTVQRTIRALKF